MLADVEVQGTLTKKAIVTLLEGYSIDLFDQGGSSDVAEKHQADIDQHKD